MDRICSECCCIESGENPLTDVLGDLICDECINETESE
jgi:hypothetical protein